MRWGPDFFIGVVAGITGTILLYLFNRFLVWIQDVLSKEANLHKKWHWFDETNDDAIGTLEIKQTGRNIRGVLTRERSTAGEKINRKFPFKGKIFCGQLLISYHEKENPRIIIGAICLKVRANRKFLYGRALYLEHDSNEIVAPKFIFSQEDKLPEKGKKYLKS